MPVHVRPTMRTRPAAAFALMLSVAIALPAAAQWKWRDAKGQTQYSDTPPPSGIPEKDILQRPTAARIAPPPAPAAVAAANGTPVTRPETELEAKKRKADADKAAKDAAERKAEEERAAAVRAENCKGAKGNLRMLEDGGRIMRYDAQGSREDLDDKTRADEIRRMREVVATDCK